MNSALIAIAMLCNNVVTSNTQKCFKEVMSCYIEKMKPQELIIKQEPTVRNAIGIIPACPTWVVPEENKVIMECFK